MTRNVFMDFTEQREISFRIGEHVFKAYPDLPLMAVSNVDAMRSRDKENETETEFFNRLLAFTCSMMYPESADLFRKLLHEEATQEGKFFLGTTGLMQVHTWLSEQVTDRPTQESKDSSPSLENTGESSMDGASATG